MSTSAFAGRLDDIVDARTLEIIERRRSGPKGIKSRGWLVRRALVGADAAGLVLAFLAAEVIYPVHLGRAGAPQVGEFVFFMACLPAWVVAGKLYGLYDKDEERADHSTSEDFAGVFHLMTVGSWLLYALSLTTRWFNPPFGKVFSFWLIAVLAVPLLRVVARIVCRRQIQYLQNTVIVGAGMTGQTIARKLIKHPEYGINLVGFIDPEPMDRASDLERMPILGDVGDLPDVVDLLDVERVIIAFTTGAHKEMLELIRSLNERGVQVDLVPRFFDVLSPTLNLHTIEGVTVLGLPPWRLSASSRLIKRFIDVVVSAVGLILLAPIFAVVAVAVKCGSSGPVFFRQTRMGVGGVPFRIWKFRTMSADADLRKHEFAHLNKHLAPGGDARMFKIAGDPRVNRLGRILRRYAIDELPQLLNVLVGHMSLVGPRPLIPEEHQHVENWERRLSIKPGMTGLWQVLGRDEIGFAEMVRLDYLYVTTWTPGRDLVLLARTFPALLRQKVAV